jgi:protein SCO1/2
VVAVLLLAAGLEASAATSPANSAESAFAPEVPDVPVQTQDGQSVRFFSDLVRGRVVAINFIFTACTTICPPLGARFGKLQDLLGDRLGTDVHLISVSVDPGNDTPDRLKAWGAQFGARPGWTLVTGRKPEIDRLLKAFNASSASPTGHTAMVLVGNQKTGSWTRAYGLAPANRLLDAIEAARTPGASGPPKVEP